MEMKDAYYFSHDSNAKDDPKCVLLIEQLGLEGYGIYWMLVETLRDQPEYKYPLILIGALARRYNSTAEKVKTVVSNYGLFSIEGDEFFYSESLLQRMQVLEDKRVKASKAGKISAQKRQQMLNKRSTTVEQPLNERTTTVQPVKESTVEEIIVNDNTTEKKFIDAVLKKYKIIEGSNPRAYMDNYKMIFDYMFRGLGSDLERAEFKKQISFYHKYKNVSNEKLHSLSNLIMKGWKECNYEEKYKTTLSTAQNDKNKVHITDSRQQPVYNDPNYEPNEKWG